MFPDFLTQLICFRLLSISAIVIVVVVITAIVLDRFIVLDRSIVWIVLLLLVFDCLILVIRIIDKRHRDARATV